MSRYDLEPAELEALLFDCFGALPSYRARQLWDGIYAGRHLDELSALPKKLRVALSGDIRFSCALHEVRQVSADDGQTTKWLFALSDGAVIETVLMHHARHSTVCVSSQAGCAMGCTFCATGDSGFARQLSVGEIVEQVVHASRAARDADRRLDHVVFMGMGEPLANATRVLCSVERIIDDVGLAARHVTVSTVGVVPGIDRLCNFPRQINLAVSLHGANDALRNELVPLNRRYPLSTLLAACQRYVTMTRRRLSFEWAMIDGVNDRLLDASQLVELARPLRAHVNLIPLNPTDGGSNRGLRGSPPARVRAFREALASKGVNVTVRRTRGREIDAACGQLAGSTSLGSPSVNGGKQTDSTMHA